MEEAAAVVRCPECKGAGVVPIPSRLSRVLRYLRASGPRSTAEIYESLKETETDKIGMTAINNRLYALEEFGLVERVGKDARALVWAAKGKNDERRTGSTRRKRRLAAGV